jgi:hypothetical protein
MYFTISFSKTELFFQNDPKDKCGFHILPIFQYNLACLNLPHGAGSNGIEYAYAITLNSEP